MSVKDGSTIATYSPLTASEDIRDTFRRYVLSTFKTSSDKYNSQLKGILSADDSIVHGPYLQISHNFPTSTSVDELIDQGVLTEEFRVLNYPPFMMRRLYAHQEDAVRKVHDGRNIVVSTGTGSGKTECFLIPILDHLMREKTAGTLCPGVRAMLLYPMNALANDQLERMRDILAGYPEITFGTFTGETEDTKVDADSADGGLVDRLPNEVYDRESFRSNPPHILITNYAMLEHLLIKPANNPLFGSGENHWRFIVLDEVHTYTGAKGSEVALLLRRLRASLGDKNLRFILTSATLGAETENGAVAKFALKLCSVRFDESDVIRAKTIPMDRPDTVTTLGPGFYRAVARIVNTSDDVESDLRACLGLKPDDDPREALFDKLGADSIVHDISEALDEGPKTVSALSEELGRSEQEIIDAVTAISAGEKLGKHIFNARYHLFVKGLNGAYVTLKGSEKLFIRPRKLYEEDDREFTVFQISTCYSCGAIYLLGNSKNGKLIQVSRQSEEFTGYEPYLLADGQSLDDLDEYRDSVYSLCSICGNLSKGDKTKCSCGLQYSNSLIKVSEKEKVCSCPVCGNTDSRRGLLRELYLGADASTVVIGSSLFKNLLSSRDSRFLAFSDSRQSAAFFAPYMEDSYRGILMKRAIYETMKRNSERLSVGISFKEFRNMIRRTVDTSLLSDEEILEAVVRECAQNNSFRSLEFLGFLRFEYGYNQTGSDWVPQDRPDLGMDASEFRELINVLIKFVRDRRAVTIASTDFKPYEYRRGFMMDGGKGIARFFNKTVELYLSSLVGKEKARDVAEIVVDKLLTYEGNCNYLDLDRLKVSIPDHVFVCSRCKNSFPFGVRGRCMKCNAETLERRSVNPVERIADGNIVSCTLDLDNHYVRTCIDSPPPQIQNAGAHWTALLQEGPGLSKPFQEGRRGRPQLLDDLRNGGGYRNAELCPHEECSAFSGELRSEGGSCG